MLAARVLSRIAVLIAAVSIICCIGWREWNPFRAWVRLIYAVRPAIPPGGRVRLAKMTETFLTEVGVLLLVFPVLDKLIASGAVPPRYVIYSFVAAVSFYSAAAVLAVFTGEQS